MLTPNEYAFLGWTIFAVGWLSLILAVAKQLLDHLAGEHEAARIEQAHGIGDDAWFAAKSEDERRAGAERLWEAVGEPDPYDRVVFVQGHRHSEPVCAWPLCETYLTREQMAAFPDASATGWTS